VIYRFGEHELDTDRFELTRRGEIVHLEPQVFMVLAYLVENRDRLVPKEELLDTIWSTRFVSESALTSRIKTARQAIGDDGRSQDMIRTVRGQGFRFVGDVLAGTASGDGRDADPRVTPGGAVGAVALAPAAERMPRFDNALRGRQHELGEVDVLLDTDAVVTLLGPGGTGKTRLAVEAARRRRDDLPRVFVDLAAARSAAAVPDQFAATLGIQIGQRKDVLTACCEYLAALPHLLVVDNCEHVVDAAATAVARIAERSPASRLLCTSRTPLRVAGEQLFRVEPLPTLPAEGEITADGVRQTPSGALFVDRARRGDHRFEITEDNARGIAALCRALDGLPLAIELAAGRLASLGVDDLLDRLDRRLDLLGSHARSAIDRHRTLRATVEWSYDDLDPDAARLWRHLAPFPAGVALETVEDICGSLGLRGDPLALLATLVDSSLLQRDETAVGARYVQLETLRAFALDRLDHHDERIGAFDLAGAWAAELVSRMDAELLTEAEPAWDARMRVEFPNVRAAREHLVATGRIDELLELSTRLHEWARLRGVSEPWGWADELLEATVGDEVRSTRAHAIAAQAAWRRGNIERSRSLAERALELEGRRQDDPWSRARARSDLAVAALFAGDLETAITNWLMRVEVDAYPLDLGNAAFATAYEGDIEAARRMAADARELAAARGSGTFIAWTAYATGEVEHAARSGLQQSWLERAVELADAVGSEFTRGVAQVTLASTRADAGDLAGAADLYHQLIEHWLKTGSWTQQWTTLRNAAALLEAHAPETALAIIIAAHLDPFSPSMSPSAHEECERLRARLVDALGDERAPATVSQAETMPRMEVARRAREALEPLITDGAG
jgi:predicted ATPase/DNA-binding winged helix-turn-helix (wHTH) protein